MLIVAQLVKKFFPFYETRNVITLLTTARSLNPMLSQYESSP